MQKHILMLATPAFILAYGATANCPAGTDDAAPGTNAAAAAGAPRQGVKVRGAVLKRMTPG